MLRINEVDLRNAADFYLEDRMHDHTLDPFPAELVTIGGAPLAHLSDETLLNAPASLLSHVIRTAANGGLQVLGPSAVPCTQVLSRVMPEYRQADLVVVGSVADENMNWPTYDGRTLSKLDAYEPYKSKTGELALRSNLKMDSIASGMSRATNPVEKSLMTAVAVVALQRLVGGDARRLAETYNRIWGLSEGTMEEFERFSVGPQGDFLRYVLGQEKSQVQANMPMQYQKTISVAMGAQTRADLGPDRSCDWARMRVVAEARFALTVRQEGMRLEHLSRTAPPGDLTASLTRPGILVFQPYVMSGFAYPLSSLTVNVAEGAIGVAVKLPPAMLNRVRVLFGAGDIRTMLKSKRMAPTYTVSKTMSIEATGTDVISQAMSHVVRAPLYDASRGKTVQYQLRGFIFASLLGTMKANMESMELVGEMLRSFQEVAQLTEMSEEDLVDIMVSSSAFLGGKLRMDLSSELGRKNLGLEEAWESAREVLPQRIKDFPEGTAGWLYFAFWKVIVDTDPAWNRLVGAVNASRVVRLTAGAASLLVPPGDIGTEAHTRVYAGNVVAALVPLWHRYYDSTARVAWAASQKINPRERTKAAYKALVVGGLLWEFRARAVSRIKVTQVTERAPEDPDSVYIHVQLPVGNMKLRVRTDFRQQWAAFITSINKFKYSGLFGQEIISGTKTTAGWGAHPDRIFKTKCLVPNTPDIRITRYVKDSSLLWSELRETMVEMGADVAKICAFRRVEEAVAWVPLANAADAVFVPYQIVAPRAAVHVPNAYALAQEGAEDPGEFADFYMELLGEDRFEAIMDADYPNYAALVAALVGDVEDVMAGRGMGEGMEVDALRR